MKLITWLSCLLLALCGSSQASGKLVQSLTTDQHMRIELHEYADGDVARSLTLISDNNINHAIWIQRRPPPQPAKIPPPPLSPVSVVDSETGEIWTSGIPTVYETAEFVTNLSMGVGYSIVAHWCQENRLAVMLISTIGDGVLVQVEGLGAAALRVQVSDNLHSRELGGSSLDGRRIAFTDFDTFVLKREFGNHPPMTVRREADGRFSVNGQLDARALPPSSTGWTVPAKVEPSANSEVPASPSIPTPSPATSTPPPAAPAKSSPLNWPLLAAATLTVLALGYALRRRQ
jgi:hypothetical protein